MIHTSTWKTIQEYSIVSLINNGRKPWGNIWCHKTAKKEGLVCRIICPAKLGSQIIRSMLEKDSPICIRIWREKTGDDKSLKTPGISTFLVASLIDDKDKVYIKDWKLLQSTVGMLLFLMKHSWPAIANVCTLCTTNQHRAKLSIM